ncbi:MAG: nucleotidyltransferase domain-containing protein [Acaryochloridaceae cyanobacterium RL_2_7]|nr:nucleotidyltransferase domain-containing protein [Acaryochloridaceae cyanobacterium RL_2_7]
MLKTATLTAECLQNMTDTIVSEVDPDKVILFGSHARGEANQQSDVDLLVVTTQPFGPQNSRRGMAARLGRSLSRFLIPTDILLYTTEEVEAWQGSRNHVITQAMKEGQVLYERSRSGQGSTASSLS